MKLEFHPTFEAELRVNQDYCEERSAGWGWIVAALLPAVSEAAQPGRSAGFHTDPVEVWGSRFLMTVICLGIAVLLFSMIKYRGRTAGPAAWWLLVAGVGVLPVISTGFGTLLVFARAERVEFCASCHLTMEPFAEDMRDPQSQSLAALHFKNKYIPENQCYTCHRSYGLFGTMEAKLSGMVNVYKYYTHTFTTPVRMREAYANRDCLKCHAESAKWQEQAAHAQSQDDLFAEKEKCLDCHGSDHPAHALGKKGVKP